MSTIDHGKWIRYTPDAVPEGFPQGTLFARRETDLVDWYAYMKGEETFAPQNVKGAARWFEKQQCYIVGPATYSVNEIFPAGHLVFEVTDYIGDDPFKDFNGKIYHPENGTFEEYVPQVQVRNESSVLTELQAQLDELLKRIAKLEK